jgi:hypothetical protein
MCLTVSIMLNINHGTFVIIILFTSTIHYITNFIISCYGIINYFLLIHKRY